MPNTITTIYTFTAGTKARAEQVNSNFDLFRGNLIPVDPTAQSSPTAQDYGLGLDSHRWSSSYLKDVFLGQTTASWRMFDDTASGGRLEFSKASTTIFQMTGTSRVVLKGASITANDSASVLFGASSTFSHNGTTFIATGAAFSIAASGTATGLKFDDGFSRTANIDITITGTAGTATALTVGALSISSASNAMLIGLSPATSGAMFNIAPIYIGGSTIGAYWMTLDLYRDGSFLKSHQFGIDYGAATYTATGMALTNMRYPANVEFYDTGATYLTAATYSIVATGEGAAYFTVKNVSVYVKKLDLTD